MTPYLKIKELRIRNGITQSALAKKAHISQSYLSELEHNKKSSTLRQLCKITEALSVHPDELWFIIYD